MSARSYRWSASFQYSHCPTIPLCSPSYLLHPPPPQPTPTSCVYLTIAPKSYPRKLAFAFLDELAREFEQSYGSQVGQRSLRPYAFVGFGEWETVPGGAHASSLTLAPSNHPSSLSSDTFLQKTKRVYLDSRSAESSSAAAAAASSNPTSSNLDRLNNDLQDVTRIMTKNMEDLLWRGDSLDQMSSMSSSLRDESMKYRKAARKINIDAMIRQYAP